jgi:hypothetical protein
MLLQALGNVSPLVTLLVLQYRMRTILSLFPYLIPLFILVNGIGPPALEAKRSGNQCLQTFIQGYNKSNDFSNISPDTSNLII